MKKLKQNKTPGPHQITAKILQATGEMGIEVMLDLCKVYETHYNGRITGQKAL